MAEEHHHFPRPECDSTVVASNEETPVEVTDRGLFGSTGKKEEVEKPDQEEVIVSEFEKVHVSEPEHKEEEKKHGLKEKLHRSSSSSSSSSSDEEKGEGGEEKKKKKKEKKKGLKEKIGGEKAEKEEEDTSVPVEVVHTETPLEPEEKKGFLEKIKDKLPGHNKKTEEVHAEPAPECAAVDQHYDGQEGEQPKEKKGIIERIKEKLPGYHQPKSTEAEKEKEKEGVASH